MKKISILSLHLGYGGVEKSITALANLLCDKYEVEIACSYKLYEKPVFDIDKRVKIIYLTNVKPNRREFSNAVKSKNPINIVKEGIKALNCLRLRRKTMIKYITHTDSDVVIATRDIFDDWLGEYGSKDKLKIGWEHNHYHDNLKYALEITRAASKLDYLVLVSKNLEEFYKRKLINSKCKCVYISNIVDNIPKKPALLQEKRLISVGRLSAEKGFIDLLMLYSKIEKTHPDWCLDIIGDGAEKPVLEEYIKKHNLETKVTLHGFQKKDYIDKMLQKSSIYLMTSHTESFGIVLIEAMSHGLPCIAFSSAEGANDLITNDKNGYLIDNRDHKEMAKQVIKLIDDINLRKELGKEGRVTSLNYTSEKVKDSWDRLLKKRG